MAAAIWSGTGTRRVFAVAALAAVGLTWTAAAAQASAGHRPPAGTITTVAGGPGGPGPATNVSIRACGLKSAGGALYFAAGAVVRRVDARTGWLTTVTELVPTREAGTGVKGCGVTTDAAGNVLVADTDRVLVVAARSGRFYGRRMLARHVYAIAGRANASGHAGNGGLAVRAALLDAVDVAVDQARNVVVADSGSPQDREIAAVGAEVRVVAGKTGRFYGRKMTAGHIYAVAGTATGGSGRNGGLATRTSLGVDIGQVRVDSNGNLVLADLGVAPDASLAPSVRVIAIRTGSFYGQRMSAGHIYSIAGNGRRGYAGNGGPARKAALDYGAGVALDHAGNVVIADCGQVRVVADRTGRFYGRHLAAGHIYAVAGQPGPDVSGDCLERHDAGDGGPASRASVIASAVTVDSAGNVLLTGDGNYRVRLIAARTGRYYGRSVRAGDIYTVAGNGNNQSSGNGLLATRAELGPEAVTTDRAGDVLMLDAWQVRMVPVASGTYFGQKMTRGVIYRVAGGGSRLPGDGGVATATGFQFIYGGPDVAADAAGNVLVADTGRHQVDVVAARTGTYYGRKMSAGHTYILAGSGTDGFSGDGGPATAASLSNPDEVTTDHAGNVLTAGDVDGNLRVRVIAARSGTFYGQQMTAGDIYTIAGNGTVAYTGDGRPATQTGIAPEAIAADPAGNVVISDADSCVPPRSGDVGCQVRVVAGTAGTFYGQQMTAGDIYTIAGNGTAGYSGDGGPATKASLSEPAELAIDSAGNIAVIVDPFNTDGTDVVRMIAARSGTFYGKKMTAGDIYTIAGGGSVLGDGGAATRAALNTPLGIAIGPAGNLLIADSGHGRVRSVTRA
jgi:hypothetical protein